MPTHNPMSLACTIAFWYGCATRVLSSFRLLEHALPPPTTRASLRESYERESRIKETLQYWSFFALLVVYEVYFEFIVAWIPLYFMAKFLLLVYVSNLNGADVVFEKYIEPKFAARVKAVEKYVAGVVLALAGFVDSESFFLAPISGKELAKLSHEQFARVEVRARECVLVMEAEKIRRQMQRLLVVEDYKAPTPRKNTPAKAAAASKSPPRPPRNWVPSSPEKTIFESEPVVLEEKNVFKPYSPMVVPLAVSNASYFPTRGYQPSSAAVFSELESSSNSIKVTPSKSSYIAASHTVVVRVVVPEEVVTKKFSPEEESEEDQHDETLRLLEMQNVEDAREDLLSESQSLLDSSSLFLTLPSSVAGAGAGVIADNHVDPRRHSWMSPRWSFFRDEIATNVHEKLLVAGGSVLTTTSSSLKTSSSSNYTPPPKSITPSVDDDTEDDGFGSQHDSDSDYFEERDGDEKHHTVSRMKLGASSRRVEPADQDRIARVRKFRDVILSNNATASSTAATDGPVTRSRARQQPWR